MKITLIIIAIVVVAVIVFFFFRNRSTTKNVSHLPIRLFGLKDIPAIPIILEEIPKTLFKLNAREHEMEQAINGLSNEYTIGDFTENGRSFMFGRTHLNTDIKARDQLANTIKKSTLEKISNKSYLEHRFSQEDSGLKDPKRDPITRLSLENPRQFEMSWTTFDGVHSRAKQHLDHWAQSLTDPDIASAHFWPTIARYGLAYNLLFLEKIDQAKFNSLQSEMSIDIPELEEALQSGALYGIDLRIFKIFNSTQLDGDIRYTPPCFIFLKRDSSTKETGSPSSIYQKRKLRSVSIILPSNVF